MNFCEQNCLLKELRHTKQNLVQLKLYKLTLWWTCEKLKSLNTLYPLKNTEQFILSNAKCTLILASILTVDKWAWPTEEANTQDPSHLCSLGCCQSVPRKVKGAPGLAPLETSAITMWSSIVPRYFSFTNCILKNILNMLYKKASVKTEPGTGRDPL